MTSTASQSAGRRLSNGRLALLAAISGGAMAVGHAPLSLWFVAVFGLLSVFWLARNIHHWRQAALFGWSVGTTYFAASMYWIVEPFLVDVGRHGWMAPFALLFLATGLAVLWALAFAMARRVAATNWLFWLALLWGAMELVRGYLFTGFPWGMFAYIWLDTPIAQAVSLVGSYGLTLISFLLAAAIVGSAGGAMLGFARVGAVFVVVALVGFGMHRQSFDVSPPEDAPMVRLVQTNAPQSQKWLPEMIPVFWQHNLAMTAQESMDGDGRPDIVVWPETAIPYGVGPSSGAVEIIAQAAQGATVIAGVQRHGLDGVYNSMIVVDGGGKLAQTYNKHHLVPFGEYIPGGAWAEALGFRGVAQQFGSGYTPGTGPEILQLSGGSKLLPLICYEAVFPRDLRVNGTRPDWILHITNDAWFGEFAGPFQHLAQARFRAIEQGLPLARAANTGVTAMIDPLGRLVQTIPLGERGVIDVALPKPLPATPYAKFGEIFVLFAIFSGLFCLFMANRRKKSH